MSHDRMEVDIITILLCLQFWQLIGWWGIVLAFAIGFLINIIVRTKKGGE